MSKIIITDINRFESIVSKLESSFPEFEELFRMQDANYNNIDGTDVWKSDTQGVVSSKYVELSKNYEPIKETLLNYIKYLKITLENYKKFESTVNNSIEQNLDNLNVN